MAKVDGQTALAENPGVVAAVGQDGLRRPMKPDHVLCLVLVLFFCFCFWPTPSPTDRPPDPHAPGSGGWPQAASRQGPMTVLVNISLAKSTLVARLGTEIREFSVAVLNSGVRANQRGPAERHSGPGPLQAEDYGHVVVRGLVDGELVHGEGERLDVDWRRVNQGVVEQSGGHLHGGRSDCAHRRRWR